MILAAPLVIPFAEAVGISIATLGMAKAADMVNDYIQENPEQSAMILKTLVPNLGIGEIFMNKEDSGDDEEVSEEEVTESGSTKDMVLEELNKEKGNYSDPEAKGNYASPRGRIIGRLRREGKIRQGNDPNYDPSKKYQGYKRFIRPKKADGGRVNFSNGGAQFLSGGNISPGTDVRGNVRNDNPFTGGGDNKKPPPVIIPKGNTPEPITFNDITGKKMLPADLAIQKQFLNLIKNKGYETGLDTEADDLYNAYRTATGLDNFQTNALVNSVENQFVNEIDGNSKSFYDSNSTITDLDTGKSTKQLMVETPTGLIQRTVRPSGIMENDIAQTFGAPQSLSVDPYYKFAEGGRVGLFMGGDPLTGQALSIYNSMNAYGFDDQAIANALTAQGLYTTPGSTPETTAPNIIGSQINQGGGDGGGGITELDPLNRPKGTPFDLNSLTKTKFGYNNALGKTIEGVKDFTGSMIDKFSGSKIGEGITSGATKFKNMSFTPMMALMQKRNPLNPNAMNYNPNLQPQMDFLEGITGSRITGTSGNLKTTDGLAMIGKNASSGLAQYGPGSVLSGQNVASAFGTNDYETQLENYIDKMIERRTKGVLTEFQDAKLAAAQAELKAEQDRAAAAAAAAAAASRAESRRQYDPSIHGPNNYGLGSDGKQSYDSGQGFGTNATTGGPVSNKSGKGRTDFSKGGLVTMFKEKR